MTEKKTNLNELLADEFQNLADTDTNFRLNNAHLIGEYIHENHPSWVVARAASAAILTDLTDGFWARTAKKIRGYDVATEGAANDPKADHLIISSMLSGLVNRAYVRNEDHQARKLSMIRQRSETRDKLMDENRQFIKDNPNIDQRELRASSINKAKMLLSGIGCVALSSPLYENQATRSLSMGVLRLGIFLGERGQSQFRRKIQKIEKDKRKTKVNSISPMNRRKQV